MFLVIGIGNPLRSDDGVGHHVVERLAASHALGPFLQLIDTHHLMPELIEPISQVDLVIFVDAWIWKLPGFVRRQPVYPDFHAGYRQATFTHEITPETLLLQAWRMCGVAPQTLMYSVCGQDFSYGEALSPLVKMAIPGLVRDIHKTCARFMFSSLAAVQFEEQKEQEEEHHEARISFDRDAYFEPIVTVAAGAR